MKQPKIVTVTGAAGQIAYSILFRIASGEMLGKDQPVILKLLDIPPAVKAMQGVVMELEDCALPLLKGIEFSADPMQAFKDTEFALLIGARPRSKGMERKDLLEANANIFSVQGKALDSTANRNVKVLVVGNPANTNSLIAQRNAPSLNPRQFTAMTRLDHNRAVSQIANKLGVETTEVNGVIIWGNHSATQYPDLHHTAVADSKIINNIDSDWYQNDFIPKVQQRGAAIIAARGLSSAASAANAAISHIRDWHLGTGASYTSMGVYSNGEYGIEKGLIYSFPCQCQAGDWKIIEGLEINDFSRQKMAATQQELVAERDAISHLLG